MENKILSRSLSQITKLALLVALLVTIESAAAAGTLTVNVQRSKSNVVGPIVGAQVCISGNFGTLSTTTNGNGTATFANAPQAQITLTASASGFTGQSSQFTMSAADKTQGFLLQPGSGGPACNPGPPPPPPVTLSSLVLNPAIVNGGTSSQGTATLSAAAPTGGAVVNLSSNNTAAATVPPSINISAGSASLTFTVSTSPVSSSSTVTITGSSGGTTRTATLTVNAQAPPPPAFANLRVLVNREGSTAMISGAAVCVASPTGGLRSAFTDLGGQATFDGVVQGQLTITVSAAGFNGQTHTSTLGASGGTSLFRLEAGSGGAVCNPTGPPPSGPATLAITSFDWHVNRRTPLFFEAFLTFAATQTPGGPVVPTHYRVGESSDLSNTPWIAYPGGVIVFQLGYLGNSLTAFGQRTVFFQIRKDDISSAVASKTVDLQPISKTEFRFQTANLSEMLAFASAKGFVFQGRDVSATGNVCRTGPVFRPNTLDFDETQGSLRDRDWVKVIEITFTDSAAKRFTPGWRVKSIDIGQATDLSPTQTISGVADGNGFKVTITMTIPRDPNASPTSLCLEGAFPLRAIVLEGPTDDMALDQTKRWKNMFPSN